MPNLTWLDVDYSAAEPKGDVNILLGSCGPGLRTLNLGARLCLTHNGVVPSALALCPNLTTFSFNLDVHLQSASSCLLIRICLVLGSTILAHCSIIKGTILTACEILGVWVQMLKRTYPISTNRIFPVCLPFGFCPLERSIAIWRGEGRRILTISNRGRGSNYIGGVIRKVFIWKIPPDTNLGGNPRSAVFKGPLYTLWTAIFTTEHTTRNICGRALGSLLYIVAAPLSKLRP